MEKRRNRIFTANHHKLESAAKRANQKLAPLFIFLSLFIFFTSPLFTQENEFSFEEAPIEELTEEEIAQVISPERRRIEMEIKTSTLSELAVWCRTLGLSESGTRAELSNRLRTHFELPEPDSQSEENRKVIVIESAQTSEYFTIDIIDEDYARLRGEVRLSMKDGDTIHRISANEILFNRTRNIMTARGQVVYEKVEPDKTEIFRGDNITVNIDNWSSTFIGGSTSHDSGGSAYVFSGAVISRNDQDVTVLSDASISSSNEEALWSISASRIWLLPGSDFAIANAVLKVGEIPVLYLPFFYFPADKLVFHPVIGYRSREGGFVQTTTYILGHPRSNPEETNSITNILGSTEDTEKKLQGIFLRSTGKKRINQDEISLKAMIDYYVNLGAFLGTDLYVPKTGAFSATNLALGVGFTRTLTDIGNNTFSPYPPNNDGTFNWNHSNFISMEVPFRYRMQFQTSLSGKYGSISFNFPYYSDPFVNRDFTDNRAERNNFLELLQDTAPTEETTSSQIGTYQWQLTGNLAPSFTALAPYISRISITNISTTLSFIPITTNSKPREDPNRIFFAPDKYTIYNISASISGNPVSTGNTQPASQRSSSAAPEKEDPFKGLGFPLSPWETNTETQDTLVQSEQNAPIISPPALNQTFSLPRSGNNKFAIDYSLAPTSTTEMQFMSSPANWPTFEDVDWSEVQSILTTFSGSGNINFRMDHSAGFYSNVLTLSGTGTWRDFSFINDEAFLDNQGVVDEDRILHARRQQYSQTNYTTSYTYNSTVRPFQENPIFAQTNFQYNLRGTLVRSRRWTVENSPDGPELSPQWGSWVKERTVNGEFVPGLNNHQLAANMAANLMDNNQTISVSTALPPLDGLITTNATFRVWISETNVNFRIEKPETSDEWLFRPINITETLTFKNIGRLTYFMVINPEENNDITSIRTTLVLWNFTAVFNAIKSRRFEFIPDVPDNPHHGGNWEQYGDSVLNPKDFSISYNRTTSNVELIRNRLNLSFTIGTSMLLDLQQHTNSNLNFSSGFIVNVPGFLKLEITATTQNSVIWRYFKNVPGMEKYTNMYAPGPQNNIFVDLIDSVNFFDISKRERTGFKMHSFDLKATHFLGDWTAEFGINLYPHRVENRYQITSDISFLVQWTPISEIKSHTAFLGKTNRWEKR